MDCHVVLYLSLCFVFVSCGSCFSEQLAQVFHTHGLLFVAYGQRSLGHEVNLRCYQDFVLQQACDILP